MSIQQEIENVKRQIKELQEELQILESCLEGEE